MMTKAQSAFIKQQLHIIFCAKISAVGVFYTPAESAYCFFFLSVCCLFSFLISWQWENQNASTCQFLNSREN